MSSAAVDNVLPVLTSRFLVLREEEEEQEQGQELLPTDLFEDSSSSPATAIAMVVSPGNSSSSNSKDAMLWSDSIAHDHKHYNGNRNRNRINDIIISSRSSNDVVNDHRTRRCISYPIPAAVPIPRNTQPPITLSSSSSSDLPVCGLFASFSSSPTSEKAGMWQYTYGSSLSPRSTNAVHVQASNAKADANAAAAAATAAWISLSPDDDKMINDAPMTPSLVDVVSAVAPPQHIHNNNNNNNDGIPTIIWYRTCNMNNGYFDNTIIGGGGGGSSSSNDDFEDYDDDDDEVSLLADDPDEDDADVLPHATYDVLANFFDEIYKEDR